MFMFAHVNVNIFENNLQIQKILRTFTSDVLLSLPRSFIFRKKIRFGVVKNHETTLANLNLFLASYLVLVVARSFVPVAFWRYAYFCSCFRPSTSHLPRYIEVHIIYFHFYIGTKETFLFYRISVRIYGDPLIYCVMY